jgi:hypothetical protein
LSLKTSLGNRPVIYEVVPPRKEPSRFNTELRGLEEVLHDSRIAAVNIPELINRRQDGGHVRYSPATIPPEEYGLMIKEYKEPIVNMITPRLTRDGFVLRARKVLHDYRIPNLVLVGKERHDDFLPGPGVVDALRLLRKERTDHAAIGGICIFDRKTSSKEYGVRGPNLAEPERVTIKGREGCDFVTSQITFDPRPALDFLVAYQKSCERLDADPVTVFISIATVPSRGILSLMERLDVSIPPRTKKRLTRSSNMGAESLKVATETVGQILSEAEDRGVDVPLGLQIEQIGTDNDSLSLELLDSTYSLLR